MRMDYICGLRDFLEHVREYEHVAIEVPAYQNDVYYFTRDGTEEQAREIAHNMLKKYHHGLLVIGVETSVTKLHNSVLKLICK